MSTSIAAHTDELWVTTDGLWQWRNIMIYDLHNREEEEIIHLLKSKFLFLFDFKRLNENAEMFSCFVRLHACTELNQWSEGRFHHCKNDVFCSRFGLRCVSFLSLPPDPSLLLCEPATLFDHTEAFHQQGHGRMLTPYAPPCKSQRSPCDPDILSIGTMSSWFGGEGDDLNSQSIQILGEKNASGVMGN